MQQRVETWEVRKRAVASPTGVVAAQHWQAAEAGAAMLRRGGNAIDAAVACAFALAVCEPWMSGLGGSGYAVVWSADEGRGAAIDFQGVLAQGIDHRDYPLDPEIPDAIMGFPGVKDNRNVVGYGAIAVPGAVRGLSDLLGRYGKLGLDTVLEPAIALAEAGLPVDWHASLMIALAMKHLRSDPVAAAVYLPDGCPPEPPCRLPVGALAETLKRLAAAGPDDFYAGALAERIAADLEAGGSPIRIEDLAAYRSIWLDTLSGSHRGAELHTAGETSGGPRLLEFLAHSAATLDPARGIGVETWQVYADGLEKAWTTHKRKIGQLPPEHGCTTHLSSCDGAGNMVALTYTLLDRFGARVMLPETGIVMNNAVSYFDPRPGYPTSMAGGKRINASNMCPTVCVRDGEAYFAIGASGANRIVPAVAQIAGYILDYGLGLEDAFHVPRVDASARGSIQLDPRMGEAAINALGARHALEIAALAVFPKLYACPQGVMRADGICYGMADPSQPIAGAAA
ncbi:MAG: gamma-glutamyltransferase [Rhodospirillales bacterium]|nr:MAG: gamma-glutamyltransferase [Rhodospirillales bacterium]